jgi:L-amino acid N-acyltransferase YncA
MAPTRFAQLPDLPQIAAICNAAIPGRMATADTAPVMVAARNSRFREFDPVQRPIRVFAEAPDGPFQGWLSLHRFYGQPAYRTAVEVGICIDLAIPGRPLA